MNQSQKYIALAKGMSKPTYPAIAKLAGVSRQAVASSLKNAGVDLRKRKLEAKATQAAAFIKAVRKLKRPTKELRPSEIAKLTGFPYLRDTRATLESAGIPFCRTRQGRGAFDREAPSELVQFAKSLPATAHLTAKEIARQGGFGWHVNPVMTLKRHGIPYRKGTSGRPAIAPSSKPAAP